MSSELILAASATDAAIQKTVHYSGRLLGLPQQTAVLIISNEGMKDIMKIFKAVENSGLVIKSASKQ